MVNHFHKMLSESNRDKSEAIVWITRHIPQLVSKDQNLAPRRVVTLEEMEEVVKGLAKNKASRLDEFTTEF